MNEEKALPGEFAIAGIFGMGDMLLRTQSLTPDDHGMLIVYNMARVEIKKVDDEYQFSVIPIALFSCQFSGQPAIEFGGMKLNFSSVTYIGRASAAVEAEARKYFENEHQTPVLRVGARDIVRQVMKEEIDALKSEKAG